jgi:alpha-tubulin suppressor-like RCC1 family protein
VHEQDGFLYSMRATASCRVAATVAFLLMAGGCAEITGSRDNSFSAIWISNTAFDLEVGEATELTATSSSLEEAPGTPAGLEWSSSDPRVLTVDRTGRVSGVGRGRATVFVRQGRLTDSASVRVGAGEAGGATAWASVHAGARFTCALDAAGERYCWGENPFAAHGNGTRRLHTAIHSPLSTGDPLRYAQLSSGGHHGCGVTAEGVGYCWGNNAGQQSFYATTPQRMKTPPLREVSSGAQHACALDASGVRYCWGSNLVGALGAATAAIRQAEPLRIDEHVSFSTVSAGFSHTCGLNALGEAFCWGTSMAGELGEGSSSGGRAVPHPISGGLRFSSISAGNAGTCALTSDGVAYCWGALTLATASGPRRGESAVPVRLDTELRFEQVSVGAGHTCGRTGAGEVFCWGLNEYGQAGIDPAAGTQCTSQYVDGPVPCAPLPHPVAPNLRFRQISVGRSHSCGVTVDSEVYCWGLNDRGQLGSGRIEAASARPVRVARSFR